jgi:hypothetical protein
MVFLFFHEHISPYGWKGIVFAVITVIVMVRSIGWLAGRKLKRLPGYKHQRPRKKGVLD